MKVKKIVKVILISNLVLFASVDLFSKDYYVSTNGNDNNSGTLTSPWRTIAKANQELQPGDTVFIREGSYEESIQPARSGSPDRFITYAAYQNEKPVITGVSIGINLGSQSYIKIDALTVDGKQIGDNANVDKWVLLSGSDHIIIQNCEFKFARGWGGFSIVKGSHHNKILNNVMHHCGHSYADTGEDWGDMVTIINSEHNLFENNDLSFGGHNLMEISSFFNVIRNNFFHNGWERNLSLGANTKYNGEPKFDGVSVGGYVLFENNIITEAARSDAGDGRPPSMKVEGLNHIVRRNVYFNNVGEGIMTEVRPPKIPVASKNKIYNNTFYNNGQASWLMRNFGIGGVFLSPPSDNVWKNNISYKNADSYEISANIKDNATAAGNNAINKTLVTNNNMLKSSSGEKIIRFKGAGVNSLEWFQDNYSENFKGNLELDPKFVDPDNNNFRLQSNSPMIDRGAFLTRTVNSGSGTKIKVEDAGYFCDGFDIVEGDLIQVGSNSTVRIIKVDYGQNLITVDRNIAWNAGDGVSLPFSGSAPDIGAFEFSLGGTNPPPAPPVNVKVVGN